MKKFIFHLLIGLLLPSAYGQIITPEKVIEVCDHDGDGFVSIPFSQLQNFALDVLSQFNESPEIYVTKAHRGIEKIIKLYDNPQVVPVCGDTDGEGGYYDIAINSQKEIYVTRKNGVLQKVNTDNCTYQTLGQIHSNGQSVLALSFDHLDNLYEGGWDSKVYRSEINDITNFFLWHDFGSGNPSGDFVQIGNYLYIAWTMIDGKDHLFRVTLGENNAYVSHVDMGKIETGTFGLAAEYGRLYGNTIDELYEINLETMARTTIVHRPSGGSANNWWGAAGYHEGVNIEISYHDTQQDAALGVNPISDPFVNHTAYQDDFVYIRVHEATQDVTYIIPVHLIINIPPTATNTSLMQCKDPVSGLADFDLTNAINIINPGQNLEFGFYNSLNDLENEQNALLGNISIPQSKTVYVKVNGGNPDCYGVAKLELIVPTPNVEYQSYVAFCKGTTTVLSVPDQFVSYQWSGLNGDDLNQPLNTHEVSISQTGDYSVKVIDSNGCTFILPFETANGGAPVIYNVSIDNSSQSAAIWVSPAGNYEYSLDGVFWQNTAVFQGLTDGDYEVQVRDKVGCYSESYKFTYYIIPNFISPNGDGKNDNWEIRGMAQYPNATIKIFDRYGKIFVDRKVNSSNIIWDGRYMGSTVASGTYWYILQLDEKQKISGHLSVRNN